MSRALRAVALIGASALVVSLGAPGVAGAAGPSVNRAGGGAVAAGIDADSTFLVGYSSTLTNKKSIVGTFTVPSLGDCPDGDEGILSSIELTADDFSQWVAGGVYSYCQAGAKAHEAVFETSTAEGVIPIAEVVEDNDKIKVTASFRRGTTKVTVENLTRGWTANESFDSFKPTEGNAHWYLMQAGGPRLPPPNGPAVPYKGVQVGETDLKQTNPTKYVLVDGLGNPLVKPSRIRNGTDFKMVPTS